MPGSRATKASSTRPARFRPDPWTMAGRSSGVRGGYAEQANAGPAWRAVACLSAPLHDAVMTTPTTSESEPRVRVLIMKVFGPGNPD